MAGCPRAPTAIVNAVFPADTLAALDVNAYALFAVCRDVVGVLCWLAQYGLIHNSSLLLFPKTA